MTEYADAMSEIVRTIHPLLKDAGFRKRRHLFNRSAEDGIVQVIGFQMGAKLPPGAKPIPGLRPDLHGRFTVNLGVSIREAWERLSGPARDFPAFANDYDCQIRERLGQILGHREDVWWPLGGNPTAVAGSIADALMGPGLDWLNSRATRADILRLWSNGGQRALPIPTAIPIVLILCHLDREEESAEILRSYYGSITDHRPHKKYVFDLAQSLGVGGLSPP